MDVAALVGVCEQYGERVKQTTAYLQDESEVVDGFAPLVDVVKRRAFVAFAEFDFLDHIGVAQDSQQHLVGDLRRTEQAHLCRKKDRERL